MTSFLKPEGQGGTENRASVYAEAAFRRFI